MKKNGFTLIELLAVIIILGIIALITVVSVNNTISDSKTSLSETQIKNVEEAAKSYYLKEGMNISETCVNVSELIEKGYVEGNSVKDPKTKEEINGSVKITYVSNQYSYEYQGNTCQNRLLSDNVKAVTESKTGIVPTQDINGDIVPGSEFKIKVNDTIGELTFFVLSNEGNYVNLIAQQNITSTGEFTSEPQDGDEWYVTLTNSYDNRYGPQKAYSYLSSATNTWTNIPIIESFNYLDETNQSNPTYGYQSIVTELNSTTGKYITTITPNTSVSTISATYENMRARLPYHSEISTNTSCTHYSGSCPLWMVNYLSNYDAYLPENGKVNSTEFNGGYWTLSSSSNNSSVYEVHYAGMESVYFTTETFEGIRPVITVLKSDLLRVM